MSKGSSNNGSRQDNPINLCDESDNEEKKPSSSVLLRSTAAARMSVKELKHRLDQYGVDYSDCLEKRELVERLDKAENQKDNSKAGLKSDTTHKNNNNVASHGVVATKRTAQSTIQQQPHSSNNASAAKRPRPNPENNCFIDSHIKLFQTNSDLPLSSPLISEHCLTLRQMLGLDPSSFYDHNSSIDWFVVSNFMVDLEYLLHLLPELYSIPTCVVFYGQGVSPRHDSFCAQWKQTTNVDFVQLDPSSEPKSRTNPLKYKFHYGVHHTKMFLVGLSNGSLRVMIHTANLVPGDCHVKTQGAYIQDFPLKTKETTCEFENDLVAYVQTYGYDTRHAWDNKNSTTLLCEHLRRYDFSSAKAVLIASTPGYHSATITDSNKPLRGYLKLSKAIRNHCPPLSSSSSPQPIVCQFSSMGSLSPKWLQQFVAALDASQHTTKNLDASTLQLVFPTAEEIRTSVEGYAGGGSVPSAAKNVDKDFLQPLYHKWSCDSFQQSLLHKPKNVPHIKTFYQLQGNNNMQWFCLTSHNLSTSAWGQVQQSKKYYKSQSCFIRHWELGVFVAPSMFGANVQMGAIVEQRNNNNTKVVGIPLPYPIEPTKYNGNQDQVFSWEKTYSRADAYGRRSTMGH